MSEHCWKGKMQTAALTVMICQHSFQAKKCWQCGKCKGNCDNILNVYRTKRQNCWCMHALLRSTSMVSLQQSRRSCLNYGDVVMEPHLLTKPTGIWEHRCPLLIIWTRINKPNNKTGVNSTPQFLLERKVMTRGGKKQTGGLGPIQAAVLTGHTLKKVKIL